MSSVDWPNGHNPTYCIHHGMHHCVLHGEDMSGADLFIWLDALDMDIRKAVSKHTNLNLMGKGLVEQLIECRRNFWMPKTIQINVGTEEEPDWRYLGSVSFEMEDYVEYAIYWVTAHNGHVKTRHQNAAEAVAWLTANPG